MAIPLNLSEVPNATPYAQYVATSGQTVYPYPFPITQDSDLVVVINGVTQSTDSTYTLSGQGNDTGGNVTLNTGSTVGDIITLYRDIAIERITQFSQNSGFSSAAFNAEFNNLYLITQQLESSIAQCLQVPNTNNPAPVTTLTKANYAGKYLSFDTNGNPIPAVLTSSGTVTGALVAGLLNAIPGVLSWLTTAIPKNATETSGAVTVVNGSATNTPVYDMSRYGIVNNLVAGVPGSDVNTPIIQAVFNMAKTYGGTLVFPYGDYSFYLDTSGMTLPVVIEANGSTFRNYSATPTQSAVIFGNNGGVAVATVGTPVACTTYFGATLEIRNATIAAKRYTGGATAGDLNAAVAFYGCSAKFWNCSLEYGKVASFYGCYAQYSEFWSTGFYLASFNVNSAGCLLDGYGANAASNEVTFNRCYFQANANGVWIKGGFQARFNGCNFQGNGAVTGGGSGNATVILDQDSTGLGCVSPTFDTCWWEVNSVLSVQNNLSSGARFDKCIFLSSSGALTFSNCYDVGITNCSSYGGITVNFTHPGSDTCQITWRGNDASMVIGTWNLSAATSKILDMHIQGSYTATMTGVTAVVTPTFNWSLEGDMIDLKMPTTTGTSNANTLTFIGMPAFIQPLGTWCSHAYLEDAGANYTGTVFVSGGTVTATKTGSATGFTSTGTKGITASAIRYPLFV